MENIGTHIILAPGVMLTISIYPAPHSDDVISNSMARAMKKGTPVIARQENTDLIKTGDIIIDRLPDKDKMVII